MADEFDALLAPPPTPQRTGRGVLADALKTFLGSLSAGFGAASQAPGRRGTQMGIAAAFQAPGMMQQQAQQQAEAERQKKADLMIRIEQLRQGLATGQLNNEKARFDAINNTVGQPVVRPNLSFGINGVETPTPEMPFPAMMVGGVRVQPQTKQANDRAMLDVERIRAEIAAGNQPPQLFNTPGGTLDANNPQAGFIPGTAPQAEGVNPALIETLAQTPERYHDLPPSLQAEVLPELAKRNVQIPPKPVDPTVQAIRDMNLTMMKIQQASGGLTPSQVASEVNTLRGQWTKAIEPTLARRDAIARIDSGVAAIKTNRNAATQIIITAFNKLQDEMSVVREGEYLRSEQGQAVMAQIQGALTRITQGGSNLTDEDLKGLATEAKNLANSVNAERDKELANTRTAIEESLKAYNIPATRVFGNSELGRAPRIGDTKKFPNGKTGKWDGQGWVAQ